MTKLEAVNIILRALGEHAVASIEIRHPSITLALDKLEVARQEVLTEGWWFNNLDITLKPEIDGRVRYPVDALAFVPAEYECITRGGYLYNTRNDSFVFSAELRGLVTYDLTWDDLPNAAQRLVTYQAAMSAYADDLGGQMPASITQGYATAAAQLTTGHLRQRRYSARQRCPWTIYERARRG